MVSIKNDLKALCPKCGAEMTRSDLIERECIQGKERFVDDEICSKGHYICEGCRRKSASRIIYRKCSESDSMDPIALAMDIMSDKSIRMHDMKHHILVACCLLTAYRNNGGDIDLDKALRDADKRGNWFQPGICGLCGNCGAAASTGIFYSIITNTTPHSKESWSDANMMTATSLTKIASIDGPRCCKRNTFIAICNACDFVREKLDFTIEYTKEIECPFSERNEECIGEDCPFHPRG